MLVRGSEPTASDSSWVPLTYISGSGNNDKFENTGNWNDYWRYAGDNLHCLSPTEPYDDSVSWYDSANTGQFPCWLTKQAPGPGIDNSYYEAEFDLRGKTGPVVLVKEFYMLTSNVPADANLIGELTLKLYQIDNSN